jgi:hypothetical protein
MRRLRRATFNLSAVSTAVVFSIFGIPNPASAKKPPVHTSAVTGDDISYPQCSGSFPSGVAFGIVGVTDGRASTLNPCFGPDPTYQKSELYWALSATTGRATQPKASLYINSADPGNHYNTTVIADWPTSGTTPDGTCTTTSVTLGGKRHSVGANSAPCAWEYGYNKATQDVSWLNAAANAIDAQSPPLHVTGAAKSYPWWLDVETANTWLAKLTMNAAVLQGMIASLKAAGATTIGIYSTSTQWKAIVGSTNASSGALYQIPVWIPGASSLSQAQSNCRLNSFTSGPVMLTQYVASFDVDYGC